jgi:hypothetical protein
LVERRGSEMDGGCLTLLFDIGNEEEVEAIHALRAAFQGATEIEPVSPELWALHIYPGVCSCLAGEEEAA